MLAAGIFFGDLWIKRQIEEKLTEGETRHLWGGRFLIRKHYNRGAVLNVGQNKRPLVAAVSVTMTAVVAVLFLLSFGTWGNNLLRVGLSFLLGGAFCNTYDRLRRKYVVDYLSFGVKWKRFRSIVFNISDFFIITGALLAAIGASK